MKEFLILVAIVWSILFLIESFFGKLDYGKILFLCLLMYFLLDNLEIFLKYLQNRKNLKKQD